MFQFISRRKAILASALFLSSSLFAFKTGEVRLRTALAGGSAASGHAEYRALASENRARLNVEVEDVNLAAGTKVDVLVNGSKVGSIAISAAPVRGGELELNSQDGQMVPSLKAGALVVVQNGDTAILSGVLN